jgi:2-polyprenyl-3-methyl-5-hydroxy-6-metoxy-1,4-benzoquinol methylase
MRNVRLGYELGYIDTLTKPSDLRNPQFSASEPMTGLQRFYLRLFGIPDTVKQQQARNVFSILKKTSFLSVLDIGCAHGQYSIRIAKQYPKVAVKGIDVNQKELRIANLIKQKFGVRNLSFEEKDIYHDSTQQKYDLILLLQVIEHLDNDALALKKIRDMMNTSGHLVLTTANSKSGLITWIKKYIKLDRRDGYTLEELDKSLKTAGFKIEQVIYLSGTIGGIIERIEKYLRIKNLWLFSLLYPFLNILTILDDYFRVKNALHTSGILILAAAA